MFVRNPWSIMLPVAVLSALSAYGFDLLDRGAADDVAVLEIEVTAEQRWLRVVYSHQDGSRTGTFNELRIPVGRAVLLELRSAGMIHSFRLPSLAGRADRISAHVKELFLAATASGVYGGQCAEYCDGEQAPSFHVVALPTAVFNRWLERERAGAVVPGSTATIGPDLTHAGGHAYLETLR
jgi:cytochrome c oxidase subunit 2